MEQQIAKYNLKELKAEAKRLRAEALVEDASFVAALDEIVAGKYWKIESLAKRALNKKGLSQTQFECLFNLYSQDRAQNKDVAESSALAILLLSGERLIHYVSRKIILPKRATEEELFMSLDEAYRRAIDTYDPSRKVKFVTHAANCVYREGMHYVDKKRMAAPVGLSELVDATGQSDLSQEDKLGEVDEFVEGYADVELSKELWKLVGHLNQKSQFCLMAQFGKYGQALNQTQIGKLLGCNRTNVSNFVSSCVEELRLLLNDPEYILKEKYKEFLHLSQLHFGTHIGKKYHLLTKEEYDTILASGQFDKFSEQFDVETLPADPWDMLGNFNMRAQFCTMAKYGKYTKPIPPVDTAKLAGVSVSRLKAILKTVTAEIKLMAEDSEYISQKHYKQYNDKKNSIRSQVTEPYRLLQKEEFLQLVQGEGENAN